MTRRAVVAMSGGVDSSVAAALLVEEGYEVTGVMLKLWRGEEMNNSSGCCNVGAADATSRANTFRAALPIRAYAAISGSSSMLLWTGPAPSTQTSSRPVTTFA